MSIFINLSNHPISTWSDKQLKALNELGFSQAQDLKNGMPLVDANASAKEVGQLAENIYAQIKSQEQEHPGQPITGAFVAGDFSLTYNLVNILENKGIRCYSATTERICEEFTNPDGTVEIKRIFSFCQWRPYLFC